MMHSDSSLATRMLRLVALLLAVAMLAAACGDDGDADADSGDAAVDDTDAGATAVAGTDDDDAADVDPSDESAPDDSGSEDAASDDDAVEDDAVESDAVESDAVESDAVDVDTSGDDAGVVPPAATSDGSLNCAELQTAFETIGEAIELDPSIAPGPADLEASFEASQGQLAALAVAAPELAGEVATVQDGLVELGAAFAGIGWDASVLSDSSTALEFSSVALPVISTMFGPLTSIQIYISSECT